MSTYPATYQLNGKTVYTICAGVRNTDGTISECGKLKHIDPETGNEFWLSVFHEFHDSDIDIISHGLCPECYRKTIERTRK